MRWPAQLGQLPLHLSLYLVLMCKPPKRLDQVDAIFDGLPSPHGRVWWSAGSCRLLQLLHPELPSLRASPAQVRCCGKTQRPVRLCRALTEPFPFARHPAGGLPNWLLQDLAWSLLSSRLARNCRPCAIRRLVHSTNRATTPPTGSLAAAGPLPKAVSRMQPDRPASPPAAGVTRRTPAKPWTRTPRTHFPRTLSAAADRCSNASLHTQSPRDVGC